MKIPLMLLAIIFPVMASANKFSQNDITNIANYIITHESFIEQAQSDGCKKWKIKNKECKIKRYTIGYGTEGYIGQKTTHIEAWNDLIKYINIVLIPIYSNTKFKNIEQRNISFAYTFNTGVKLNLNNLDVILKYIKSNGKVVNGLIKRRNSELEKLKKIRDAIN